MFWTAIPTADQIERRAQWFGSLSSFPTLQPLSVKDVAQDCVIFCGEIEASSMGYVIVKRLEANLDVSSRL